MTLRILVVGAGIAGLAAARGLRVAGFRPDVVEELPATMLPRRRHLSARQRHPRAAPARPRRAAAARSAT